MMVRRTKSDRGATAITVAIAMVLLMGMAAIAIDLGLGFNERRQDQTAADLAVMAGATDLVLPGGNQLSIVDAILDIALLNLDTTYDPGEWQAIWESCTDPERIGFDVGIGTPVNFQEMAGPWGSDLECISQVSSYLRVRIPDQITDTGFARIIGFNELTTHAAAVARIETGGAVGAILPFGIPGGTLNGEICAKSSGSGPAIEPCQGPSAGGFGEIDSEFFGDFFGSPDCGLPGATELAQNVALGIDHAVSEWPSSDADVGPPPVTLGLAHPGDNTVRDYQNIGYDACKISGGALEPEFTGHVTPPNTMRVGVGYSPKPIEDGLVSNQMFLTQPSRLQQGSNPPRNIVDKNTTYSLDNKGLWDYLNPVNSIPLPFPLLGDECDGNTYAGLPSIDEKVAKMHDCLAGYDAAGVTTDLFVASIDQSPRLVWAPEYWHAASASGKSWQPINGFRLIFIAGVYFNCSAVSCGVIFYPDLSSPSDLCDPDCSKPKALTLHQLTAFLLPFETLPGDSIPPFPGAESPLTATLFK